MPPPASAESSVVVVAGERHHQVLRDSGGSSRARSGARHNASSSSTNTTQEKPPSKKQGGASSPEEIARQHSIAQDLVESGRIDYAVPDWKGEIPLHSKQCPAIDHEEDSLDVPCWSSRGHIDVTMLQALVRNGYNRNYQEPSKEKQQNPKDQNATAAINYWDPDTAATQNVAIRRPSHDAWGIPKIVLLFCDDFLQDCFELPFYKIFAKPLQPVLDCLQIEPDRMVRLLMASLPAGTTIPVHHDTGEWVKHTHRVHVPVLVNDSSKIVFTCGAARIDCRPGHVFEINNQCRHAVSNCDQDYRVHLILDYVDRDFLQKPKIRLEPAEVLWQTRRSIDRMKDAGKRPTPSFLILGAQKAGTTFLFEIIMQHPWLIKPVGKRRETHCLDWRWRTDLTTTGARQQWCHKFFHYPELQKHPSCLTGDSTPSYLLDSARVIPRLREVFPHPLKFFVMCRDPVQRAESHYAMVTSTQGTPAQLKARGSEWRNQSFDQIVCDDWRKMKECGLLPYWTINNKNDADDGSLDISAAVFDPDLFEAFAGTAEEDAAWERYLKKHIPLNTGSYSLLARGLYELNLRPWLRAFAASDFLVLKLEAAKDATVLQETLQAVWKHLDVPYYTIPNADTPKNARDYDPIASKETRAFLQRFYQPHNQRLQQTLLSFSLPAQQQESSSDRQRILLQHWSQVWEYDGV